MPTQYTRVRMDDVNFDICGHRDLDHLICTVIIQSWNTRYY